MDKIKPILAAVAKHVFWGGCGTILIVSVVSWYMARDALRSESQKNKGNIKSKYDSAKNLQNEANPPNQHSHAAMDKLNENTLQLVLGAWQHQYSHQENILRWPASLKDDFVAAVRPLKPIELKVDFPTPPEQKLIVDYRHRYADYVDHLLPRLAEVVRSRWMVKGAPGAAMSPDARKEAMAQNPPLVLWEPQDQGRLVTAHFDWSGQPDSAPTTLQVLYAQEDLWVLTALVHIINKANGNVESRHDAVVKSINSIEIGRAAFGVAGQVGKVGGGTTTGAPGGGFPGGGDSGSMGDMGGGEGMGMGGGMGGGMGPGMGGSRGDGMGGMGNTRATADPADLRYVDNDYVPLPATKVREAMKSGNPDDAFLVVAKRMPIRLRLLVDQRKLHRLLSECGNSLLPVEIRQVRVNRTKGSGGAGGYGMGGGYGGMEGSMEGGMDGGMEYGGGMQGGGAMGLGGYGGSAYGGGGSGGASQYGTGGALSGDDIKSRAEVSATTIHDVPVELYGIIYIYNPVDRDRLGIEESSETPETSETPSLTGPAQPVMGAPG